MRPLIMTRMPLSIVMEKWRRYVSQSEAKRARERDKLYSDLD